MSDFMIENGVLTKYTGNGGDIIIPNGVKTIEDGAFEGCTSLTSVNIPDSVRTIGDWAFARCTSLTSVIIGNRVRIIGSGAFCDCKSLKSVTISNSVTVIEWSAFEGCTSLTSVTIPNSVTEIAYNAFNGCTSLTNFTYHGLTFSLVKYAEIDEILDIDESLIIDEILDMVENRDFSVEMNHDVKYSVIWSFFVHNPDDEPTIDYIKENFTEMFPYLIDENDIETVTAIVNSEKFLTKRNIDKMIDYAIEKERHEIYVMLLNYKAEKLGFKDIADQFKL